MGSGDDLVYLLHVWGELTCNSCGQLLTISLLLGSPYEMGYAHGSLLKERAQDMLNSVWSYFELQVVGRYK